MRKMGDYPDISKAHMAMAKKYSSTRLLGPPICDELVSLVEHMFSEEEAQVARNLKPWRPTTAKKIAAAAGRPLREVEAVLDVLAHEKHVLLSFGMGDKERYCILPIIPGTFESVLIRKSADSVTPWHVRFAELHEELFSTGFTVEYLHKPVDAVRYLPVDEAVQAQPMAFPLGPSGGNPGPLRTFRGGSLPVPPDQAADRRGMRQAPGGMHSDG